MISKDFFTSKKKPFVIAEIGKNFIQTEKDLDVEDYLDNAKKLVDAAKLAGADAVKFQTHVLDDEQLKIKIKSPHFQSSDRYSWVKRNSDATPIEFWENLNTYCKTKEIQFFSTPMSRKAALKINHLVPFWKVGSGDIHDYLLLRALIETRKPIIISTGMVSLAELDSVVNYLKENNVEFFILYCISKYPCPKEEFNLSTINYFKEKYPEIVIGFSDHSIGYEASLAAVKLGAKIIEKHFTLDRKFWGSDHKVSMEPSEMKEMVELIKSEDYSSIDVNDYYGNKTRELEGSNNIFRPFFEKKIVASDNLQKGVVITEDLIYTMRPSREIEGIPSNQINRVIGKITKRPINKYESITLDNIQ
tara:strand:- start:283 stop:1365 length:1083 start_codon:yes stop_codon:yes gene_type:complete